MSIVELENPNKVLHHVLFAEKIKVRSLVLLRVDDELREISNDLHVKMLISRIDINHILQAFYQRTEIKKMNGI